MIYLFRSVPSKCFSRDERGSTVAASRVPLLRRCGRRRGRLARSGHRGHIGISLAVLLFLPILGAIDGVRDWLPTTLTTAPVDMLSGASLGHYAVAIAVAVASRPTLLTWGVRRLRQRDG